VRESEREERERVCERERECVRERFAKRKRKNKGTKNTSLTLTKLYMLKLIDAKTQRRLKIDNL
jgi:hypothetical protein